MNALHNSYLFKALDNYPYDLAETIEALNYALSYDNKNPITLALAAKVYAEQLYDFETARQYYEQALAEDIYALSVYPDYISLLIKTEELDKAEKLIGFALTLKGIDKAAIYYAQSHLWHVKREYKQALDALKNAKLHTYSAEFLKTIDEARELIKSKMPQKKKAGKKNSIKE